MSEENTYPVSVEDLTGSTPTFFKKAKPKAGDRPTAGEVLVDLALDKAMDEPLRSRLANNRVRAMIVAVPDGGWVGSVADSLEAFVEGKLHIIGRATIPKDRTDPHLTNRLGAGRAVVGVSPDPDRALPELLLSVADTRVTILPPDAAMVVEVIKRAQGGRIPARAAGLKVEVLTFDEITSLIITGGKATESVERLEAAIAKKLRVGAGAKSLPKIEEAIEYGAARQWALDLRDDLIDVRRGIIGFDQVDRGAVLHGPPGTGKTLLAQMLGEACGIPTVIASVGEFFASSAGYLDSVIKAQRKVFDEAKAKAPCILFLDEINALPNADTVSSRGKDWWMPVILDFYQLLDGAISEREGVIVIGATNRIEDLNPALLRPGRLERAIYVGPPDAAGIERIMRHHLAGDLADAELGELAMIGAGHRATGAVVMEHVRAARRKARRAGRPMTLDDLKGQIVTREDRSADELRRSAIHETGHAVAGLLLKTGTLVSVNILSTATAGGITMFREDPGYFRTRSGYEASVMMLLAGRAAEHLLLGEPSQGSGGTQNSDLGRATQMIAAMFTSVGLGDSLVFRASPDNSIELMHLDRELTRKVEDVLTDLYTRVTDLLREHSSALEAIAAALVEKRLLAAAEVESMLAKSPALTPPG